MALTLLHAEASQRGTSLVICEEIFFGCGLEVISSGGVRAFKAGSDAVFFLPPILISSLYTCFVTSANVTVKGFFSACGLEVIRSGGVHAFKTGSDSIFFYLAPLLISILYMCFMTPVIVISQGIFFFASLKLLLAGEFKCSRLEATHKVFSSSFEILHNYKCFFLTFLDAIFKRIF